MNNSEEHKWLKLPKESNRLLTPSGRKEEPEEIQAIKARLLTPRGRTRQQTWQEQFDELQGQLQALTEVVEPLKAIVNLTKV